MSLKKRFTTGFTLTEVIVVMSIVGILGMMVVPVGIESGDTTHCKICEKNCIIQTT